MSNKEYVPYEKSVNVTVHEHRATTDQSVQLLNEFQEKAQKNIIDSVLLEDNIFKASFISFQDDVVFDQIIIHIQFILNGVKYSIEEKMRKRDYENEIRVEYLGSENEHIRQKFILKKIHKIIAEIIAKELLTQFNAISK